jgi:hypothetical protein
LEEYGFDLENIDKAAMRAGKLEASFDARRGGGC